MRWLKKGRIFTAAHQFDWMAHHASVPIADRISDSVLRIYFGPRDAQGQTRPGFIEVEADNPTNVLYVHDRPVLDLGKPGTFDDSGVMPSCIVNDGPRKLLYYLGWERSVTVPYRHAIGLAVSTDGGVSFERVFEGPVVDRTPHEPYFCTSAFVLRDATCWRLWYASTTEWANVNGRQEPRYHIKYAESLDGIEWSKRNISCIEYANSTEASGRPCVVKDPDRYRMWYSYRDIVDYRTDTTRAYRMGYAESPDGTRWERLDHLAGIEPSAEGWDSMMIAYPSVYEHRGVKHLLYVGNGFGETGFGYAVLVGDDR